MKKFMMAALAVLAISFASCTGETSDNTTDVDTTAVVEDSTSADTLAADTVDTVAAEEEVAL